MEYKQECGCIWNIDITKREKFGFYSHSVSTMFGCKVYQKEDNDAQVFITRVAPCIHPSYYCEDEQFVGKLGKFIGKFVNLGGERIFTTRWHINEEPF